MPCCTAFFQSRGLPDSAPHTLLSTPPFGLRCRPPLRLARRSLLTIPPHGRRSPLVHLSSPRWNQPFPVPQLGSRLCIPSRRRSTPSALPRSQASSLFLPSPRSCLCVIYVLSVGAVPIRGCAGTIELRRSTRVVYARWISPLKPKCGLNGPPVVNRRMKPAGRRRYFFSRLVWLATHCQRPSE